MSTHPDLDAIAAREQAATPGPWGAIPDYGPDWIGAEVSGYLNAVGELGFGEGDQADADRAFVIGARTDVPALLSEVRRLRAELNQTIAERDQWNKAETQQSRHLAHAEAAARHHQQTSQQLRRELTTARREGAEQMRDLAADEVLLAAGADHIRSLALPDEDTAVDNGGAPAVWSNAAAPGGMVCGYPVADRLDGICGMPVESEPCTGHAQRPPAACPVCGREPRDQEYGPDGVCRHTTATRVHRTARTTTEENQ